MGRGEIVGEREVLLYIHEVETDLCMGKGAGAKSTHMHMALQARAGPLTFCFRAYLFFDSLPAQVTPPSRKDSDRRDETDVDSTERDAGACVISVHSPGYFIQRPPADEAPSSSQALREPLPIRSSRTVQG